MYKKILIVCVVISCAFIGICLWHESDYWPSQTNYIPPVDVEFLEDEFFPIPSDQGTETTAELEINPNVVELSQVSIGSIVNAVVIVQAKNAPIVFDSLELVKVNQKNGVILSGTCMQVNHLDTDETCTIEIQWQPKSLLFLQNQIKINWREDSPREFKFKTNYIAIQANSSNQSDCEIFEESQKESTIELFNNGVLKKHDGKSILDLNEEQLEMAIKEGTLIGQKFKEYYSKDPVHQERTVIYNRKNPEDYEELVRVYHKNGAMAIEGYKAYDKNGMNTETLFKTQYENGTIRSHGFLKDGVLDGVYKEFNEDGSINAKAIIDHGILRSFTVYYTTGEVAIVSVSRVIRNPDGSSKILDYDTEYYDKNGRPSAVQGGCIPLYDIPLGLNADGIFLSTFHNGREKACVADEKGVHTIEKNAQTK